MVVYRPAPKQGVVTRIIDGDTLEIRCESGDGMTWLERVRIYGIDSPERREPGFAEATRALGDTWPPSTRVRLEYPERKRDGSVVWRDAFGRLLATLFKNEKGDER